jgi:DNA adenine methylase
MMRRPIVRYHGGKWKLAPWIIANLPPHRTYADHVDGLIERLRGVVIECRDAMAVMVHQDSEETLHYVDPPYLHSTRSTKVRHNDQRKSYKHEMSDDQHVALADGLKRLQGMVVLSGYPSPLYEKLYENWVRLERAAHADGARDRIECLWMNDAAATKASQQRLIA